MTIGIGAGAGIHVAMIDTHVYKEFDEGSGYIE